MNIHEFEHRRRDAFVVSVESIKKLDFVYRHEICLIFRGKFLCLFKTFDLAMLRTLQKNEMIGGVNAVVVISVVLHGERLLKSAFENGKKGEEKKN